MFDKNKFAQIIKTIKETYSSQEEFSKKSDIGRTYLSQYMNTKLDEPPKPKILEKLANASNGVVTYKELMDVCGYSEKTLENSVLSIYEKLERYHKYINNGKSDEDNNYEIAGFIEDFQTYLNFLDENLAFSSYKSVIFLADVFNFSTVIEDYKYIGGFILIYNEFLKLLEYEDYISIINYRFIDCFNIEEIYDNLTYLEHLKLLSVGNEDFLIKADNERGIIFAKYINSFSRCLTLAHLSKFDNNSLIDLFKKKAQNSNSETTAGEWTNRNKYNKEFHLDGNISYSEKYYLCPVYGQISAGQPNWVEECIEGYLPIDPDLMNIINPEEYYFLRVNGESMNKVIKNGAFALIHKQDDVENGEIAVVLVNGFDATLKKFTKQGDLVILEPQSSDDSFETQVYDKTTTIKILGKYVGKMEINK